MSNFKISALLIDQHDFDFFTEIDSCDLLVNQIMSTVTSPPAKHIDIDTITENGRKVRVHIPNDKNGTISILVDGNKI